MATKDIAKSEASTWKLVTMKPERVVGALQAIAGPEGFNPFDLPRITIPSGGGISWEVMTEEGVQPMRTFDALILHHHDARKYWEEEYGVGARRQPDCQSYDGISGLGNPGGSCIKCPLRNNMKCSQGLVLYLLLPHLVLPSVLWVPVMSLKNAKGYFINALAALGDRPCDVMTRFGLEARINKRDQKYSAITFNRAEDINPALAEAMEAYREKFIAYLNESFQARTVLVDNLRNGAVDTEATPVSEGSLWGEPGMDSDMAAGIMRSDSAARAADDNDDIPM